MAERILDILAQKYDLRFVRDFPYILKQLGINPRSSPEQIVHRLKTQHDDLSFSKAALFYFVGLYFKALQQWNQPRFGGVDLEDVLSEAVDKSNRLLGRHAKLIFAFNEVLLPEDHPQEQYPRDLFDYALQEGVRDGLINQETIVMKKDEAIKAMQEKLDVPSVKLYSEAANFVSGTIAHIALVAHYGSKLEEMELVEHYAAIAGMEISAAINRGFNPTALPFFLHPRTREPLSIQTLQRAVR